MPTNFTPRPIDLELDPSTSSPEDLLADAQMREVERLCRKAMPEVVGALLEKATGIKRQLEPNEEGVFEPLEGEDGKPILLDIPAGPAVTAGKAIIEFGYGKPTQQVKHSGDSGGGGLQIVIQQLSDGKITEVIDVHPTPEASVSIADRSSEPVETP